MTINFFFVVMYKRLTLKIALAKEEVYLVLGED